MPELHIQLKGELLETSFGEHTSRIPLKDVVALRLTKQNARTYGRELFEYITQQASLRNALTTLPRNTRLLLMAEHPKVAAIPWEYMRLPDESLLAARYNLVRGVSQQYAPVTPELPLSIVAVPVSPVDEERVLNVEGEWRNLMELIKKQGKELTLRRVRPPTLGSLSSAVDRDGTVIVQFMGHSNRDVLLFENDFAASERVSATQFVNTLDGRPYLVILNSCYSALTSQLHDAKQPSAGMDSSPGNIALAVVRDGIPYALGMQFALYDYVALHITDFFYDFLLRPNSIEEAVRKTRTRLESTALPFKPQAGEELPTSDWLAGLPVLYTCQRDPAPVLTVQSGKATIEPDPERLAQAELSGFTTLKVPAHFLGRADEIQEALRLFSTFEGGFIVLHGPGGIGKTSLAPAIVERVSWRYDDRVLYTSFETFTRFDHANQVQINEEFAPSFYNTLSTFYGIDAKQFPDEQMLQNAIIARRKYSRSLLVLDNIETLIDGVKREKEQAIRLATFVSRLKEDRNVVLLTSRDMPPSEWGECQEIHLEGLSAPDGARLFLSWLAQDRLDKVTDADCLALSRCVQGHPLCIRLLAARFSDEKASTLHDFLDNVQQELEKARLKTPGGTDPRRLATLSECLEYSLRRLTSEQRQSLSIFALFQAPFLQEWAEYVYGNEEQAATYLQNLKRLSLLEVNTTFEQAGMPLYEMHPMLRSHIKEAVVALHDEIRQRYALVYENLMRQAWNMEEGAGYDQNPITRYLVLQSLPDCEAALQEEALAPHDKSSLAYYLAQLYERRGQVQRSMELYKQVLKTSQELGNIQRVAAAQHAMADVLVGQGKVKEAMELYEQALKTKQELGDVREVAVTQHALANVLVRQGRVGEALELYEQSLKAFEELGDVREVAVTQGAMADVLVGQGKVKEAMELYEQSLKACEELGDVRSIAVTQGAMANVLVGQGKVKEAMELYEQALQTKQELGDVREVAVTQHAMADVLVRQGRVKEALELYKEALRVYKEVGDVRSIAVTQGAMADVLVGHGKVKEAMELYEQSLKACEELGDVRSIAVTQGAMADVLVRQGKVKEAMELYEQSLQTEQELGDVRGVAVTQQAMANVLVGQGKVEEGMELYEQALQTKQELGDVRGIAVTQTNYGYLLWQQEAYERALHMVWQAYNSLSEKDFPVDVQGIQGMLIFFKRNFAGDEQGFDALWLQATSMPQPDWLHAVQAGSSHRASGPIDEATQQILEAIVAFVNTPDWDAAQTILTERQEILFQEEAEAVLGQLIAQSKAAEEPQVAERLEMYLAILQTCKAHGIEPTFERVKEQAEQVAAWQAFLANVPFDPELIPRSIVALSGGPEERMAHSQYLTSLLTETEDEQLKVLVNTLQQALSGSDMSKLGQDLTGVYQTAWQIIVMSAEQNR